MASSAQAGLALDFVPGDTAANTAPRMAADARLARGVALIAQAKGLPVVPAAADLFSRAFLPPPDQRVRSLTRLSS